jgi:hypothetical protein
MAKALTIKERAGRHRIMAQLRSWIAKHELERKDIAFQFGITPGHLRTLLNSNRTASEDQCQRALVMMDSRFKPHPKAPNFPKVAKPLPKKKKKVKRKATRKPNNLRPLTKAEGKFVKEVAESWLKVNKNASSDEYIEIVRALGIGIRS